MQPLFQALLNLPTHTTVPTLLTPLSVCLSTGDTHGNLLWKLVSDIIHDPSPEQVACQKPKPILLDTGEMDFPYPWQPQIIPLQILAVGQLVIIAVPAEFT